MWMILKLQEYSKYKEKGTEEVEKMDKLLSLAVTGGDFSWI